MKKKVIIWILLILSTNLYSENVKINKNNTYNGSTIETVYTKNDKDFDKFDKKIEYFDAANKIKKREYYHSKKAIDESGIVAQFQYYNEGGIVISYEIIFSEKAVDESNINKIIEFVDAKDNVTRIEYYSDSKLISVETDQFHLFNFTKFKNFVNDVNISYQAKKKEGLKTDSYIIETAVVRGKAISVYQNRMEDITDKEFQFLINYSKSRKDSNLENYIKTLYKRKILVKENDITCWVFMQESLIPYIKENQIMVIKYYYFGAINDMPVFMAVGYDEL